MNLISSISPSSAAADGLTAAADILPGALPASTLLDALPDAAVFMDMAGTVQYLNPSAMRLLGVSLTRVRGRPVHEILPLLDGVTRAPIHEPLAYLLAGADIGPSGRHDLLQRRDGTPMPFEYSIGSIRTNAQGPAGFILLLRDASGVHARIEQLTELARRDDHTELLRRGEFERRLARTLAAARTVPGHALLFMDLDRFKTVNDHAGHAAGDTALREVAARFRAQVRERDVLARLGGDEFGLLLKDCPLALARERAGALRAAILERAFNVSGRRFVLGVSIGIAAVRTARLDARAVISAADSACYRAKQIGDGAPRICEVILE